MQFETWYVHILNVFSGIEPRQNIVQLHNVFPHYPARVVVLVETVQPLVANGLDHAEP
jgi:hypothetical protein